MSTMCTVTTVDIKLVRYQKHSCSARAKRTLFLAKVRTLYYVNALNVFLGCNFSFNW